MNSAELTTLAFWGGWKGLGIAVGTFWLAGLFDRMRQGYPDLLIGPRSLVLHVLLPFAWAAGMIAPLDERAKRYALAGIALVFVAFALLYFFVSLARERKNRPPLSGAWLAVLAALALPAMLWVATPRVVQIALLITIYGLALSPMAQAGWRVLSAIATISNHIRWRIRHICINVRDLVTRGRVFWYRIKRDKTTLLALSHSRVGREAQSALFELGAGRELLDKIGSGFSRIRTLNLIQERRDAQFMDWVKESLFDHYEITRSAAARALEAIGYQPDWSAAGILFRIVKQDVSRLPGPGTKSLRLDWLVDLLMRLTHEERQRAFEILKAIAAIPEGVHEPGRFLEKLKTASDPPIVTPVLEIASELAIHSTDSGLREAVLDWLLSELSSRRHGNRRAAALGLLKLYREGSLDKSMKRRILAHKSDFAKPHEDYVSTSCRPEGGRWYAYDVQHVDYGIGVDFDS